MSRNHRKPGVIQVICTDSYHRDEPEFAELGHHHIGTLVLAHRKGFADAGFKWYGPREKVEQIETRDQKITMTVGTPLTELPLPVKMWRDENDRFVYRFRCTCGGDVQRHESYLARIVARWWVAKPDSPRVVFDITRL